MTKQQAGQLGGLSTFKKYGREYMREIGKRGAMAFFAKYDRKPYGQYLWAIVRKSDNVIIRTGIR